MDLIPFTLRILIIINRVELLRFFLINPAENICRISRIIDRPMKTGPLSAAENNQLPIQGIPPMHHAHKVIEKTSARCNI